MTDEVPVAIPDLCSECGGACITPTDETCPACDGYGMVLVTDEGPDEEPDEDEEDDD
jgi:DnaJ-class molecular chaperone